MSTGLVVCSICHREVHQDGPEHSWTHFNDQSPRCEGAEILYAASLRKGARAIVTAQGSYPFGLMAASLPVVIPLKASATSPTLDPAVFTASPVGPRRKFRSVRVQRTRDARRRQADASRRRNRR